MELTNYQRKINNGIPFLEKLILKDLKLGCGFLIYFK